MADDIESGKLKNDIEKPKLEKILREVYDWDILAAKSLWAFGPDNNGPNVLIDDSLPQETNKKQLYSVSESII